MSNYPIGSVRIALGGDYIRLIPRRDPRRRWKWHAGRIGGPVLAWGNARTRRSAEYKARHALKGAT